jgi:hypothetical protein
VKARIVAALPDRIKRWVRRRRAGIFVEGTGGWQRRPPRDEALKQVSVSP